MFTLKGLTASISTNEEEKQVFNERLQTIQEKKGIVFTSFKDVFTHLQTIVLQDPEPQLAQGEVAVEKETLDKLAVNSQKLAQILSTLENYPKTDGLQEFAGYTLFLKSLKKLYIRLKKNRSLNKLRFNALLFIQYYFLFNQILYLTRNQIK